MAHHPDTGLPHGKKRPAEGDPDDQPLAKKFGRLQIDPVVAIDHCPGETGSLEPVDRGNTAPNGAMMLDDTKHTIYIHDLDREIEEIDKADSAFTIIPGLGENLSTIPRLLVPETGPKGNELVLYREPASLTVPEEEDSVRRALIETRERARQGTKRDKPGAVVDTSWTSSGDAVDLNHSGQEEDRMDLDTV
ncbi:hypothetical protein BDV59DRAFT_205564 [Aspergillus ambiguus]|uniref:uncharacterized protein n=1 Tax=Aspergillus ambiguus TaxID=176160 RepID=UPI003CCCB884